VIQMVHSYRGEQRFIRPQVARPKVSLKMIKLNYQKLIFVLR